MENLKTETIIKSYGKHWEGLKANNKQKALKNNGWIDYDYEEHRDIVEEIKLESYNQFCSNVVRPESLRGIENNNGWKIIDSTFEWGKYNEILIFWDSFKKEQITELKYKLCEFHNEDYKKRFTHYKNIEISKPPIY